MAARKNNKMGKKPYKKRATKRTARVGLAVKRYVKQAINRELENKEVYSYAANQGIGAAAGYDPVAIRLSPSISQGVGKSQRIGNEVMVKSGLIKGYVNVKDYNSTSNPFVGPMFVKIWLCSCKETNSILLADTNIDTTFYDVNNANLGIQGNMLDMLLRPNKERWIVHATKTVKVGFANVQGAATGTSDNSSFSAYFQFNFGKHLGKLKFEDEGSIATNKNLWLVFTAAKADGSSGNFSSDYAEFHYVSSIVYQDA